MNNYINHNKVSIKQKAHASDSDNLKHSLKRL